MNKPSDQSTYAIANYIREYLDTDNLLSRDDDAADVIAGMDMVFYEEGGCGVTVEQMAQYLKSL